MKKATLGLAVISAAALSAPVTAATLYSDAMDNGASWTTLASSADTLATFGYDYSADGIPEAPNSVGGAATSGVKLQANIVDPAAAEHMTLVPNGQNFSGTYQLRFDAWMNYSTDDFYNNGQAGTTEFMGGGIGHDNASTDIGSGVQAISTGDGGSGSDWRIFEDGAFLGTADMVAGTRNGFDPHYSDFLPAVTPPAAQSQAAGDSVAGSPAFQWITWQITAHGNGNVLIEIEKPGGATLPIAQVNCEDATACSTDGNISLFYADFFSSVSPSPNHAYGIIDNVTVTDVPEPASLALMGLGGFAMLRRR